jgi:serine/threonine-protein kinase
MDDTPLSHPLDEQARSRFEAARMAGRPDPIEEFLPPAEHPHYLGTLRELVLIDLVFAWKAWQQQGAAPPAPIEAYLSRFPCLDRPDLVKELVQEERRLRGGHGDLPTLGGRFLEQSCPPEEIPTDFQSLRGDGSPTRAFVPSVADNALDLRDYQLFESLGKGGMGEVYLGRDPGLNRLLAVKVMRADLGRHREMEQRFAEEARITGSLQHPNIVPVHNLGRLPDGRLYFTMKVVRGQTLSHILRQRRDPGENREEHLAVFEQVCQAVAYAHSKRVIHRDLKPANVMVGAFGEVQVMDWGLAKVLDDQVLAARPSLSFPHPPAPSPKEGEGEKEHSPLPSVGEGSGVRGSEVIGGRTQRGDPLTRGPLGTPEYMAPEQANGDWEQADERVDVFGLGSILCVILTGSPPFRGSSTLEILDKAQRGDLADAYSHLEGCGADAALIALAKDSLCAKVSGRPRNAGVVAQHVKAYLTGLRERLRLAELESARAQVKAAEERKRSRLMMVLAAAGLVVIVLAAGSGLLLQERRARARQAEQRRAQAEEEGQAALARGRELREGGWQDHDRAKLIDARAQAVRALDIARSGAVGADWEGTARALEDKVEALLLRWEKNRTLLAALLDVGETAETTYREDSSGLMTAIARKSADEQYADAFRAWGLDVDHTEEKDVLARLKDEPAPVREEIIAGLDTWMVQRGRQSRPKVARQRLFRIAQQLDENVQRRHLRELLLEWGAPRAESVAGLLGPSIPWPALWEVARGNTWRRLQELPGRIDPTTAPALTVMLLSQAHRTLGNTAEAEQLLRQALASRPGEVVLLHELAVQLEGQGNGRLGEVIECYRAIRARRPQLGIPLGNALVRAGRAVEGEAIFRDLLRQRPKNPELLFYLGQALREQKKFAAAEVTFRQAIGLRRNDYDSHNQLGNVLRDQKKLAQAEAAYREAIRINPAAPFAYGNLGAVLREQRKLDEAAAACRRAISLEPTFAFAHNHLGLTLWDQKKMPEAAAACREAIRLKPDYLVAYSYLGSILEGQNKLDEAAAVFRRVLRLKPDFAEVHSNLGGVLARQKKLDEAVPAFRRAIRLKPESFESHFNLGYALMEQKKQEEAVPAFREAVRLRPDYYAANVNLAVVLYQSGRFKEAVDALSKAGDLLRSDDPRRQLIQREMRAWQRSVMLDGRLAGVLKAADKPAGAGELIEFAQLCAIKKLHAAVERFYREAFAADPARAENVQAKTRYNAACAAALAGCGQGKDAGSLDDRERTRLRRQALDWLRADLNWWSKALEKANPRNRAAIAQQMEEWQTTSELAGIRDSEALARVPEDERKEWQRFWADVTGLRQRASKAK